MRPNHSKNRNGDADSNSQKLHKLLAQSGLGSRRGMEQLIEEGKVSVNGQPATVATRVTPEDNVLVDGRRVNLRFGVSQPRVLLYHKPEGEIVSKDDPEGRSSVFDKLPAIHNARWIAIGRLDINTSGLLLFTNHGDLANALMHPRFQLEREYAVRLLGRLNDDQMDAMDMGVELEDGPARVHSIEDRGGDGANHWYHIVIKEGRNREVRRLFEALGLTVSRLIRVRFGNIEMPPYLKRGQQKELSADQVREVMQWAGVSSGRGGNAEGRAQRGRERTPGRGQGQAQRRGGQQRREFANANPFGVMSSGKGEAQQRRGRGNVAGGGNAGRPLRRGPPRAVGPMDMGTEEQRRSTGGPGQGQGQQRRGRGNRQRRPEPGVFQGPRTESGAPWQARGQPGNELAGGNAVNTGERRGPRRNRKRGKGNAQRFGSAPRAEQAGNDSNYEQGANAAPLGAGQQRSALHDEFGDRNGNIALPEAAASEGGANRDPRSAARRPNRRRRRPVTT